MKLNLLLSYAGASKTDIAWLASLPQERVRILIDSGAFTAHTTGKKIGLGDYMAFLRALPFTPWGYFALDVIGDPLMTLANYLTMLRSDLSPIPIWTPGADEDVIEELFDRSDRVGIGGLVGARDAKYRVHRFMAKAKGRKVHWLGFIRPDFVQAYRPASMDSTSWYHSHRFGNLELYAGHRNFVTFTAPTGKGTGFREPNSEERGLLASYDLRPEALLDPAFWTIRTRGPGWNRAMASMRSHLRYMRDCKQNGTLLFLASGPFKELWQAYELETE